MAHEPEPILFALKRVDRSKHFMLGAIAALFFAVLFTFGFLMAHARDTGGNAKMLFGAAAAEMQLIHEDPAGVITIVGTQVVEGPQENAAWTPYVDAMTTPHGTDGSARIDWPALLPTGRETYRYNGSLTTPPCTEGVKWLFFMDPIRLSAAQIAKLRTAYDGNVRPIQEGEAAFRDLTADLRGD
jgi:hypothetical protein